MKRVPEREAVALLAALGALIAAAGSAAGEAQRAGDIATRGRMELLSDRSVVLGYALAEVLRAAGVGAAHADRFDPQRLGAMILGKAGAGSAPTEPLTPNPFFNGPRGQELPPAEGLGQTQPHRSYVR